MTKKKKISRQEAFGIALADITIEAAHLTYNAPRGIKIIKACIKRLEERIGEIKPKKASPEYKEARYGNKKNKKP